MANYSVSRITMKWAHTNRRINGISVATEGYIQLQSLRSRGTIFTTSVYFTKDKNNCNLYEQKAGTKRNEHVFYVTKDYDELAACLHLIKQYEEWSQSETINKKLMVNVSRAAFSLGGSLLH